MKRKGSRSKREIFRYHYHPDTCERTGERKENWAGGASGGSSALRTSQPGRWAHQSKDCTSEESRVRQEWPSSSTATVLSHWLGPAQGQHGLSMTLNDFCSTRQLTTLLQESPLLKEDLSDSTPLAKGGSVLIAKGRLLSKVGNLVRSSSRSSKNNDSNNAIAK